MINQSRRTILKTITYAAGVLASASSAGIWAMNSRQNICSDSGSMLPTCDITIYQNQSGSSEIVSLFNLTGKTVTLDKFTPVALEHINGSLIVKLNQVPEGVVSLKPGQRFSFEIEAISHKPSDEYSPVPNVLAGRVKISSDHPTFNGVIPVTVFDSQTR